jgi:hypothetical protein
LPLISLSRPPVVRDVQVRQLKLSLRDIVAVQARRWGLVVVVVVGKILWVGVKYLNEIAWSHVERG